MEDEKIQYIEVAEKDKSLPAINTSSLNTESLEIINKIIAESDVNKTKDLTYLFNANQNKKTIVRVNKLNELLDIITDQAISRFSKKPDEISNKELMDGLKTVSELIERGQKQVVGEAAQPLIQINQQTNEVNVGDTTKPKALSRDSREKVKNAVMNLLNNLATTNNGVETEIVDADTTEIINGASTIEGGQKDDH